MSFWTNWTKTVIDCFVICHKSIVAPQCHDPLVKKDRFEHEPRNQRGRHLPSPSRCPGSVYSSGPLRQARRVWFTPGRAFQPPRPWTHRPHCSHERHLLVCVVDNYIQDFKNYWLQRLKSGLFSVITVLWLWCYVNRPATPAHILNGLQSISLMMTKWPIDSFFAIFCPCIILVCLFLDFPFMLSSRCLDKSFAQ